MIYLEVYILYIYLERPPLPPCARTNDFFMPNAFLLVWCISCVIAGSSFGLSISVKVHLLTCINRSHSRGAITRILTVSLENCS